MTNMDARFARHDTPRRDHRQSDNGQHVGHDVAQDEHQDHAAGAGMGGHSCAGGDGT